MKDSAQVNLKSFQNNSYLKSVYFLYFLKCNFSFNFMIFRYIFLIIWLLFTLYWYQSHSNYHFYFTFVIPLLFTKVFFPPTYYKFSQYISSSICLFKCLTFFIYTLSLLIVLFCSFTSQYSLGYFV